MLQEEGEGESREIKDYGRDFLERKQNKNEEGIESLIQVNVKTELIKN
jgi:hypothetical protein